MITLKNLATLTTVVANQDILLLRENSGINTGNFSIVKVFKKGEHYTFLKHHQKELKGVILYQDPEKEVTEGTMFLNSQIKQYQFKRDDLVTGELEYFQFQNETGFNNIYIYPTRDARFIKDIEECFNISD